ncbi:MAG: hypothetical protein ABI861_06720 [Panacibacter sp.]
MAIILLLKNYHVRLKECHHAAKQQMPFVNRTLGNKTPLLKRKYIWENKYHIADTQRNTAAALLSLL